MFSSPFHGHKCLSLRNNMFPAPASQLTYEWKLLPLIMMMSQTFNSFLTQKWKFSRTKGKIFSQKSKSFLTQKWRLSSCSVCWCISDVYYPMDNIHNKRSIIMGFMFLQIRWKKQAISNLWGVRFTQVCNHQATKNQDIIIINIIIININYQSVWSRPRNAAFRSVPPPESFTILAR